MIWQDHLGGVSTTAGFKESWSVPCMFQHSENNVNIVVRVDDICSVENEVDLKWMIVQLKVQYDLKKPKEHQEN